MYESFILFISFAFFMLGTPGPANMLIMLSSSRHGLRSSMSFNAGLITGKMLLNLLVGMGVGVLFSESILFQLGLQTFSVVFMIYVTIRNWTPASKSGQEDKPLSFLAGLAVQPLMNPKAWIMSAVSWSNYAPSFGPLPQQFLIIILGFAVVGLICHTSWGILGAALKRTMGSSLVLSRTLSLMTLLVVLLVVGHSVVTRTLAG